MEESDREFDLTELEFSDLLTNFKRQLSSEMQVEFDHLMEAVRSKVQKAMNTQADAVTEIHGLLNKFN